MNWVNTHRSVVDSKSHRGPWDQPESLRRRDFGGEFGHKHQATAFRKVRRVPLPLSLRGQAAGCHGAVEGVYIIRVPGAVGMKQYWELFWQWSLLWTDLCFLLGQAALWLLLVKCSGAGRRDEKWFLGCVQIPQIPLFLQKSRACGVYKKLQAQSMQYESLAWRAHSTNSREEPTINF